MKWSVGMGSRRRGGSLSRVEESLGPEGLHGTSQPFS